MNWNSYAVENSIDLAIGVENGSLASELSDLADNDDVLTDVGVEQSGGDAGCRYGLHLEVM
jgi:uncharacterized membrane protein